MSSIFWTPGAGPKPWWVPPPIEGSWEPKTEIKLGENWDLEQQLQSRGKDSSQEEMQATLRKQQLGHEIQCWNADFIKDLPEEQQWAFVDTMKSLQTSILTLSNGAWREDHSICGALYGQNQAKIQMTSSLLGGKYADKLQSALDWFYDNTIGEPRDFYPIYKDNPKFTKFEQLFKQLGNNANAGEFKHQLKTALNELIYAVGDKFSSRPKQGGGTWANFVGFLVKDWDNYFSILLSQGSKDVSAFLHKIDVIA